MKKHNTHLDLGYSRRFRFPVREFLDGAARGGRVALGAFLSLCISAAAHGALIVVDTNNDDSSLAEECDLRDAIQAANSNGPVDGCAAGSDTDIDRIEFAGNVGYILLTSDLPSISESLHIVGPGRDALVVDGDDAFTQFHAQSVEEFLVSDMKLFQGDHSANGGCLSSASVDTTVLRDLDIESCRSDSFGGGIHVFATDAEVARVELDNNRALRGGGIYAGIGTMVVTETSFLSNQALDGDLQDGWGGGLYLGLSTESIVSRSTFWNNEGAKGGAALGLMSSSNTSLTIQEATFTENSSGGIGGALHVVAQSTLANTILAANGFAARGSGSPDLSGGLNGELFNTAGTNYVGDNTDVENSFPEGYPNVNGDWVGGTAGGLLDPQLELLGDYGGPTRTLVPSDDSPVVDRGVCIGSTIDQRGWGNPATGNRPVDGNPNLFLTDDCDIGAVELGAAEVPLFADGFESGDTTAWQ